MQRDRSLEIVGQGIAGACVAWELWRRKIDFRWLDCGTGGSSRIAAGMTNPITGKNFQPSWRLADFLPEALSFYAKAEAELGAKFWHSLPVVRLAETEKEWGKISAKLHEPEVAPWISGKISPPAGWLGAVELRGGGRLDMPRFIACSREFFAAKGMFVQEAVSPQDGQRGRIWCEGAAGILTGRYGLHRCAKGEILTLRSEAFDRSVIKVGAGGWLVPISDGGFFKAGSTYEWDSLDDIPTATGRQRIEEIIRKLGGSDYQVTGHDAGIRPILRRSQPLIGPVGGDWMLNGLGSKGALYAPGIAARLVRWIVDGTEPESDVDFRKFLTEKRT